MFTDAKRTMVGRPDLFSLALKGVVRAKGLAQPRHRLKTKKTKKTKKTADW